MTVVYQDLHTQEYIAFMKGAPEWILDICSHDIDGNEFTDETKSKLSDLIEEFATEGLVPSIVLYN
jgi:magnesium-transporting ATPase (P-type)